MISVSEPGRIGIFQYDWSMYSFTKDFVIKLAEAGYSVDIFQKDPDIGVDFADAKQFAQYKNIRYFNFRKQNTLLRKVVKRMKKLIAQYVPYYANSARYYIDDDILGRSHAMAAQSDYLCLIGIEKKGLLWAGILSQRFHCPLLYYSLELYIEDHPRLATALATREFVNLRRLEKKYHQLCEATIIQHELRAKALQKYNEIGNTKWIYLPISVRGDVIKDKSMYFHHKYNINEKKKVLLYFGAIQDERYSTALVKISNGLDDNVMLVLHGFGNEAYLDYLQSIALKDRVIFSLEIVEEEKIADIISSSTIGLALYENTNSNDRLAAFSSAKMAYYMQSGVPVIAFNSESFTELMTAYKCGELIDSINEIPEKVEKILDNYSSYRNQAFMAFKKYYDYDINYEKFIIAFSNSMKKGPRQTSDI